MFVEQRAGGSQGSSNLLVQLVLHRLCDNEQTLFTPSSLVGCQGCCKLSFLPSFGVYGPSVQCSSIVLYIQCNPVYKLDLRLTPGNTSEYTMSQIGCKQVNKPNKPLEVSCCMPRVTRAMYRYAIDCMWCVPQWLCKLSQWAARAAIRH